MNEIPNCFFPVIEIDSKIISSIRLDPKDENSVEITVLNPEMEAMTKRTRDSKNNTVLSLSSKFPDELFPIISLNQ